MSASSNVPYERMNEAFVFRRELLILIFVSSALRICSVSKGRHLCSMALGFWFPLFITFENFDLKDSGAAYMCLCYVL